MGSRTHTFLVHGMRCAGCVSAVERQLLESPGVASASVNLATGEARIQGQSIIDPQPLIDAIRQAGFEAEPAPEDGAISPTRKRADDNQSLWLLVPAGVLAAVVMVLHMAYHHHAWADWLQFAIATVIQAWLGAPFYRGAWHALQRRRADMDTLVALGTSVAYGYSAVVLLTAIKGDLYFDTAVMILVLIGLGRRLEHRARRTAGEAIRGLMELQPPTAIRLEDGKPVEVPVGQIVPGDHLLIKPGQRIAVDGSIIEGQGSVDQAIVTGESLPVELGVGDQVIGGTINLSGSFTFEATRTGKQTVLARIIEQVREAQSTKSRMQRLVDRVSGVFVPIVVGIAVLSLAAWTLYGDPDRGLFALIAVLIVACPCALGLATPMAMMVGTGLGARRGILIRNTTALEQAGRITHIILDKTGTLTEGHPKLQELLPAESGSLDRRELLHLAAGVESRSEHPLARAIVEAAGAEGIDPPAVEKFVSMTAGGVSGRVDGREVVIGRPGTLAECGVDGVDERDERWQALVRGPHTPVMIAVGGRLAGFATFGDSVRPEAAQVVKRLREMGLSVVIMTGDQPAAAREVASKVGIDDVEAGVFPGDKQRRVTEFRDAGHRVAMVGDGVNDAPALAAADLGIAIGASARGGGTDIAMDSGDIVLVGGKLTGVPTAIRLSRATFRRIKTGLGWAFIYNIALIPLAAAGMLNPMYAAAAMSLSSVSVVINALSLRWMRFD
ncbi:MAG: copper-translocating P-type ATPase [Phycisphaeraceae bacterium]|nr:copper-translocating P-type ATPase [Phycisphaeraceae bacterium]